MITFLKALFAGLAAFADWLRSRQLIEAGKAEQANEATKEVERRVEQADRAVSIDDPARDERLRRRFDRSRGG